MTTKRRSTGSRKRSEGSPQFDSASRESAACTTSLTPTGESIQPIDTHAFFERQHILKSHLKGIACLPGHRWLPTAFQIPTQEPCWKFTNDEIKVGIETYEGDMHVQRYRYGRAVQPTGTLDDLAPVIGAVKIEFLTQAFAKEKYRTHAFHYARRYLNDLVLASLASNDMTAIKKIQKFGSEKPASHPHYLIWEAIDQCMSEQTQIIDETSSQLYITLTDLPGTKDIKAYVQKNRNEPRFWSLANLDDPGWSRVFVKSGAKKVLIESRKGKNR